MLPHTSNHVFITDGGLETTLIFLEGHELPCFAACHLLVDPKEADAHNSSIVKTTDAQCANSGAVTEEEGTTNTGNNDEIPRGYEALDSYYRRYLKIANDFNAGFIFETPTWRANPDWLKEIGHSSACAVQRINRKAVELVVNIKKDEIARRRSNKAMLESPSSEGEKTSSDLQSREDPPLIISGCVGPRGDGYVNANKMTIAEARDYHAQQIALYSEMRTMPMGGGAADDGSHAVHGVDMITAITMNYVEEAIGIALAAHAVELPVVISFTVETDGKLADGHSLREAIEKVDAAVAKEAHTGAAPIYYMINCAHPSHFMDALSAGEHSWLSRIGGIRANASCKSHAELDEATALDRGDPIALGEAYGALNTQLPSLKVFGGCCGTDEEHVTEMSKNLFLPD